MRIEKLKINDLIPAEYNPRKIAKTEFERLKRSILEFGYVEPLIVNERTKHVVGGHQRLKALQELGYDEIDCVILDCDENQEKSLNVTLNKITGTWEKNKLYDLLEELEDVTLTGYTNEDVADYRFDKQIKERTEYWGDNRERTYDMYRMHEYDVNRTVSKYQMPTLKACHYIPDYLVPFDKTRLLKKVPEHCGVHFFVHDYVLEGVWRNPYKYMNRLKRFPCVLTPNFSLYADMPIPMKMWNIYRSLLIGQIFQDAGYQVIPTLSWSEPETFDFCFEGLEQGGVVAVSTVGHMKGTAWRDLWIEGMKEAIKRLKPECVLLYGFNLDIGFDFGEIKVKTCKIHMLDRNIVKCT